MAPKSDSPGDKSDHAGVATKSISRAGVAPKRDRPGDKSDHAGVATKSISRAGVAPKSDSPGDFPETSPGAVQAALPSGSQSCAPPKANESAMLACDRELGRVAGVGKERNPGQYWSLVVGGVCSWWR